MDVEARIIKPAIHYSRTTAKQGRNDEKPTYGEQSIKGVCHVPQTGFSPYAVRRICVRVAVSSINTKNFFIEKKLSAALKLTANNEQCTATRSSHFRQQYFIRRKNNFVPQFVMFAHVREQCIASLKDKKGNYYKI